MKCQVENFSKEHEKEMRAVQDSMYVLSGKWKIPILTSICYYNKRRFSDFLNDIDGISNRMLSKELKDLEIKKLINRKVLGTQLIIFNNELPDHGLTHQKIINNLPEWEIAHRKRLEKNNLLKKWE